MGKSPAASRKKHVSQFFAHPQALVESGAVIGHGTRVWAFVHILPDVVIGRECNICDHVFVESGVRIGSRVTVKCGVYLWDGVTVEDDVFIGPAVAFTNDLRPRSKQYPPEFLKTTLKVGCSVGANATILPGVTVGRWAMIGAGAVVTRDVPDFGIAVGNPARLRGWICRCGQKLPEFDEAPRTCECGRSYQMRADRKALDELHVH